jgi:SAM-dependent methyltransferase
MINRTRIKHLPALIRWLIRLQYDYISALQPRKDLLFMNFGYAYPEPERIPLEPEDEVHRYPLQLYHHLAQQIEWTNADVLEVSSGRGGGASYIVRRFKPQSYIGVDFSPRAVEFCRSHHTLPGLTFEHGYAEDLPFADHSFDVIVNVEASLYYPAIRRFFEQVNRLLKPGGHFLYTDLRFEEERASWFDQIRATGMQIIHAEDITARVLEGLALDRERRIRLVNTYAPAILRGKLYYLIGLAPDSPEAATRLPGRQYWSFVLRKI